jgi:hypothetical protein
MAKSNGIFVFGLLAAGAVLAFRSVGANVKKLTAKVSRVKIKSSLKDILALRPTKLDLTLEITNPTRNNYDVESFIGQALYNGLVVSDIMVNKPVTLAANMITPVVINFEVNTRQLIEQLAANLEKNQQGEPIQIMGTIKTTIGVQVPINQTVRITL